MQHVATTTTCVHQNLPHRISTSCMQACNRLWCLQVFKTLVEALLGDLLSDDDEITGISYEHFFRACRERFLVSSDAALRVHMTEFKDHDMLKTRKGPDGGPLYYVPLDVADLKQLLEALDSGNT